VGMVVGNVGGYGVVVLVRCGGEQVRWRLCGTKPSFANSQSMSASDVATFDDPLRLPQQRVTCRRALIYKLSFQYSSFVATLTQCSLGNWNGGHGRSSDPAKVFLWKTI
jgi:hypothetical protein